MFGLKTMKTGEIYRNYLKSMSYQDLMLKCSMSNDSKNKSNILKIIGSKSNPLKEKRKAQMKTAHKVFDLIKGDDNLEKCEGDDNLEKCEADEKVQTENLTSKISELIKTATAVPKTSTDTLEVTKAISTPKKALTTDAKKQLLERAKEVAVALGVDVEMTQKDLIDAYETKKVLGYVEDPSRKFGKTYRSRDLDNDKSQSHFRDMESSGLNIFTKNVGEQETRPTLETWNQLKKITLLHSSFRPPRNYFDELINWTLQGKLWHFPIDNDQSWKEELETDFTEHIFLDKHLEPWCPKTGPVRHFMELVITGLSKNPYLSVKKKKEHIFWYKNYFESKSTVLAELGVLDPKINVDAEMLEAGENKS